MAQIPEWARPSRGRRGLRRPLLGRTGIIFVTHRKIILLVFSLILCGAFIWHNYHVVPNPITLILSNPSSNLSSQSSGTNWAMAGYNLQHTRYVTNASSQPHGRLLWSTEPGYLEGGSYPAIADGILHVGSHFKFVALKTDSGQVLWEKETPGLINSAPALAGDKVYYGSTDQYVYALDRLTGETQWASKVNDRSRGSPPVHNGYVFVGSTDRHIYALDAENGEHLWNFKTDNVQNNPPSLHNGILYFASIRDLHSANYRTGQARMNFRTRGISSFYAPVVANGLVYLVSDGGILTSKAEIREVPGRWAIERLWRIFWLRGFPVPDPPPQHGFQWRFSTQLPGVFIRSAPAVTPEALYVGDDSGLFYARAAKDPSKEIWTTTLDAGIESSPVIVDEIIYVGTTAGSLYALNRDDGSELWHLSLGSGISLPPSYAEGKLFVRTDDGKLHAVE